MYVKENIFRLIVILLIVVFAGVLFFTVRFLKKQSNIATNPSDEVISAGALNFDQKTFDAVLKKVQ